MTKSLKALGHQFADTQNQIDVLENGLDSDTQFEKFSSKLDESGLFPLTPTKLEILQVNVGYMCNMTCKHCHVDAGPDRKEIMDTDTMMDILDAIDRSGVKTVDLTGGAPEMNPHFRWFVEEIAKRGCHIIDRCNLTILLANKKYHDLPEFFKKHKVEVVSSLPFYTSDRTDKQRGDGVFDKSIEALKRLNEVGYGMEDHPELQLNLVYNPNGAFLPPEQQALTAEYKKALWDQFQIKFNDLFAITNLPISRYLDYLVVSGNYESYMQKLIDAYNPVAASNVMCRNTISVDWKGYLYDCDFNQMLELKVADENRQHIRDFDLEALENREIVIGQHCYGCTAGAGSSCGGSVT